MREHNKKIDTAEPEISPFLSDVLFFSFLWTHRRLYTFFLTYSVQPRPVNTL